MRHLILLQLFILLSLSIVLSNTEAEPNVTLVKPGCPDKCGKITIPFPWGLTPGCYLNKAYFVNCTGNGTRAQIHNTSVRLVRISTDGHLLVRSPVAHACYKDNGSLHSLVHPHVTLSRFPLSPSKNMITVVGCDTQGNIKNESDVYKGGCPTMRGKCEYFNGLCSGKGCCQVPIDSANLTNFYLRVVRNDGNPGTSDYNKCSRAFIIGEGQYNFSSADFNNEQNLKSFNMRLDWTVGNISCEEAQKNEHTYACQKNSHCYNIDDVQGYRCNCSEGYQGNPYLQNGCRDIDECKESDQNECTDICQNTDGSYTCSCPKGYFGDGRKSGKGCSKRRNILVKFALYLGISMGITITSVTMICIYLGVNQRRIVKRREKFFKQNGGILFQKLLSEFDDSAKFVKIFTEDELKKATNNFNQNNILGQGGCGTVYKGTLTDNTVVAIKKSKVIDRCQIEQFVNEVVMLSQISHPNVVKILGCCLETHVPLLVYEFITNKTLFYHLHGKDLGSSVTWEMRLTIAAETAEALAYMHSTTQIIHRDIKSSNILLNDDYTAKVSDFGISRFVPQEKTHVSTAVQGTLGYIDPEYFRSGILTEKSDVYSFGVVLVELLTGEIVHSFDRTESNKGLAAYFVTALKTDSLIQVIDNNIRKHGDSEELRAVAELAKLCLQMESKRRPSMKIVREKLHALVRNVFSSPDSFTRKSEVV